MLTLTCKAAIKAVTYIGLQTAEGKKVSFKDVALHIHENEHTVGKLLQKLSKAHIVNSLKGPYGGFWLSEEQYENPIIKVVIAIDGDNFFTTCGLGLQLCNDEKPCPFHDDFKPIREQFRAMCNEKRVKDFYEDVNKGLSYLVG